MFPLASGGKAGSLGRMRARAHRRGSERIVRVYSTQLAVALLRRHGEMAAEASEQHHDDDMREVRDRILEKLELIRQRDADRSGVETKGFDRIGLICWAIKRSRRA